MGGDMNPQSRECAEWRSALPGFTGGQLDGAVHAALRAHLDTCAWCRAELAREDAFTALLSRRLGAPAAASAAFGARIRTATAQPASAPTGWMRVLGSPWAPRLAMAAVLAFLVVIPLWWLPHRTPAIAETAAEQHRCHGLAPGAPLPPCCTAIAAGIGDRLGPPSAGVAVPDLGSVGMRFEGATHCTFAAAAVNLLAYRDAAGERFSLYISDRATREFKTLRAEERDGVLQSRSVVTGASGGPYVVTMWQRDGLVWTWVGSAGSAAYDAALRALASPS
jgi:hypothetical protein